MSVSWPTHRAKRKRQRARRRWLKRMGLLHHVNAESELLRKAV